MSKKLFILTLLSLTLTSCSFEFTNDPNAGSIFSGITSTTSVSYNLTSNDISLGDLEVQASLTFYNSYSTIGSSYSSVDEIYEDITNVNDISYEINDYSYCYPGVNALLVGRFGNTDGNINFLFSNSYSYVEIVATPVYVDSVNYDTGSIEYTVYNSCIAVNDSDYIRLSSSLDSQSGEPVISRLVFNLNSNSLNILSGLDQAYIMEINLY